jgi:predicted Ser/Thr protein kinase
MRTLDRYQVSRELGRGGMAVVYLARQTELDRWVALKELRAEDRDPSAVRRFLRESRLAGSLAHPNIVTVLDFFEADGTGYIAMEYVPHGSLRPYVGELTLAQVAGVLENVLAALSCAERHGIVHRDVKPENVMVTWDGRVKLTDFGIAKATDAASMLTAAGTTLGTPHYMAPEQAMAQAVGPWTDLYSVGCMAYELVTGRLPFGDSDAPTAILLRHVNETPPPASAVKPGVDQRLSDWIEALMAKDPAARPQTAADAWETLEELVLAVEGPRWRRSCALPTSGGEQIPGPLTPPPTDAVPLEPIFETFHEPAASRPPTDPGAATPRELEQAPAEEAVTVPPRAAGDAPVSAPASRRPAAPVAAGPVAGAPGPVSALARRRRGALVAAGLVAAAAAGGAALLAGADDPSPPAPRAVVAPPAPLRAGAVRVELPAGWRPLSLPIDVPGLPRDRAAAPGGRESGGVVLAGLAPRDAHTPALLSPKLGAAGGSPVSVRLGRLTAYRHDGLRWNGRALTVYAAPTSAGVATVACLSPASAEDCTRIAESLEVPGAAGFPLGPDPSFATAATRALKVPARSLKARTPQGQASAARRIAADYRTARRRLARITAGPADEPLVAALGRRLGAAADAYRGLGATAAANDRRRYTRAATRARAAESGLRTTVRKSLYRDAIDVARPRSIASLRRPPVVKPGPAPPVTPSDPGPPTPAPYDPGPTNPGPSKPGPTTPRCMTVPCGGRPPAEPTEPDFGGG